MAHCAKLFSEALCPRCIMHSRTPHCLFLIVLVLLNFWCLPIKGQAPTSLRIVVVEGQGAINNIRQRVNREPIILVQDESNKPLAGASVTFFLPNQGPGGTFTNGTNSLTTATNTQGQAVARGIRFNNQAGSMEIRVSASLGGQTASAIITQTNVLGSSTSGGSAGGGMSRTAKILIIAAVVSGGAAIGILATHRGGSTTTTPTTTITPGSVTVGAPQ